MNYGLIETAPKTNTKKMVIIALVGVVAIVGAVLLCTKSTQSTHLVETNIEPMIADAFAKWKVQFKKVYISDQEEAYRMRVFRDFFYRMKAITDQGNNDFTVGLTKFADLTQDEFKARYLGGKVNKNRTRNVVLLDTTNLPATVDWRTQGAVTPVKDQGQCGSCWAFSATGAIEGANFVAHQQLVSVSEQQLVDCSGSYGNEGCNGGLMDYAFQYAQAKGLELESDYPYTAVDGKCKYVAAKATTKPTGFTDVAENDEDQLAAAVAAQPTSVAIEADQSVFQGYTGGVITSKSCGTSLDHGVLAVGYDTTQTPNFWIVKNSWGSDWGEQGYVRIGKSSKKGPGICGIAEMPSYATF